MDKEEFQPVGVVICPECAAQNLSWCMGCWKCGNPLFDENDPVEAKEAAA